MNKLDKIRQLKQSGSNDTQESRVERRERLRDLVTTHGFDAVSAATDWKVSTISQYLRNRSPMISEIKLSRAEEILTNI